MNKEDVYYFKEEWNDGSPDDLYKVVGEKVYIWEHKQWVPLSYGSGGYSFKEFRWSNNLEYEGWQDTFLTKREVFALCL